MTVMVCVPLGAQTVHRDSVIAQARYLKSIYRTDEAIEALEALAKPGLPVQPQVYIGPLHHRLLL